MPKRQPFSALAPDTGSSNSPQERLETLKSELEDLLGQVEDQILDTGFEPSDNSAERQPHRAGIDENPNDQDSGAVEHTSDRVERPTPNDSEAASQRPADRDNHRAPGQKTEDGMPERRNKYSRHDLETAISQILTTHNQISKIRQSGFVSPSGKTGALVPESAPAPMNELVGQVEGLHRSVRDLFDNIAARSDVDRIEALISRLAEKIDHPQTAATGAVADQLTGLHNTVTRLVEIQEQQTEHDAHNANSGIRAESNEQFARIEDSIRAIDRKIEALEQDLERPDKGIETIANGVADIARAVSEIQKRDLARTDTDLLAEIRNIAHRLDKMDLSGRVPLPNDVRPGNAPRDGGITVSALKSMEERLTQAMMHMRQTADSAHASQSISADELAVMENRICAKIAQLQSRTAPDGASSDQQEISQGLLKPKTLAQDQSPDRVANASTPRSTSPAPPPGLDPTASSRPAHSAPEQNPATAHKTLPLADDQMLPQPRSLLSGSSAERQIIDKPPAGQDPTQAQQNEPHERQADDQSANRESFIAAARRATQSRSQQEEKAAGTEAGGLLGRALARMKPAVSRSKETQSDQATKGGEATSPHPDSLRNARDHVHEHDLHDQESQSRHASENTHKQESASQIIAGRDDDLHRQKESFLSRNRRPILLGASVVAIIAMAANLILDGTAPKQDRTIPNPPETLDLGAAPRQINLGRDETDRQPQVASLTGGTELSKQKVDLVAPQHPGVDQITTSSIPEDAAQPAIPSASIIPDALRKALAAGDARAQFDMAIIFSEGRSVPKDPRSAFMWFKQAAAGGNANALHRLGEAYENGIGVEKDMTRAQHWYLRSAEAGNRMGMHNLAVLFANAPADERDFSQAAYWFREAAKHDVSDSQFNLGVLYARGLGVAQDFEEAYKWFSLAAGKGDRDAAKARDDMVPSIDPAAIARLKREVADWQPVRIDLASNFAPVGTWATDFNPGDEIRQRKIVLRVQLALNRLGFDSGKPDGLIGPRTREAIRQFERGIGMSEIGEVNSRLLTVLGSQPV